MSEEQNSEIEEIRSELSRMLSMPVIDDVMTYMFIDNLQDGKVWANYQLLKDFFTELQHDTKGWASTAVRELIDDVVISRDIDHALTRIMGFSGFSYVCEVGNDYLYANALEAAEILGGHFSRLAASDQAAFLEISHRYGELLKKVGR